MINNLPSYARNYESIIATRVGKDHWFYGAYDLNRANEIALEMRENGQDVSVFRTEDLFEKTEPNEANLREIRYLGKWLLANSHKNMWMDKSQLEAIEDEKRFLEEMSLNN